jgi:thioredoxin-related protein
LRDETLFLIFFCSVPEGNSPRILAIRFDDGAATIVTHEGREKMRIITGVADATRTALKNLAFSISAFCIIISPPTSAQTADSLQSGTESHARFDPRRDAGQDLREAMIRARKEQKNILLDVGGEWCIWCRRLDSLFASSKDLDAYLVEHYVVVKVNVSKENRNTAFLSRFPKIEGYPHLFVLDENGKLMCSQETGAFEFPQGDPRKGHDKQKIFVFLKQWAER